MSTYDPTYASQMAEGEAPTHMRHIKSVVKDPASTFMRMIVLEVISDPYIVDDDKISYWRHILHVSNYHYSNLLPRNTIIAQRVKTARIPTSQPMFLFPFFPSHLSLPCKPGEMVWAMFEDPNAKEKDLGFWFCRVSEPHIGDDVNHTHVGTKLDQTNVESLIQRSAGGKEPVYELRNGVAAINGRGEKVTKDGTAIINPPSTFNNIEVFEQLITTTDASRLMQYESVPRFRKRPGDIAIEGSNNSLIVLGTDRPGPIADYTFLENLQPDEQNPGAIPNIAGINATSAITGSAGSIDLVAGRGILPATGGTPVSTISLLSSTTDKPQEIKKEIAKYPLEKVSPTEGDPDLINDRSRVLISQRTTVDSNFGTAGYNSQFKIGDSNEGDAAITIKTDKVRIIARSDISLIVTNFQYTPTSIDNTTAGYKADNTADQTKWASITIKTNGDIVFTPSKEGYIKLGGDDAKKAIICTDYDAQPEKGQVKAKGPLGPVLVTNDGASFGSGATNQGKVATKILVK